MRLIRDIERRLERLMESPSRAIGAALERDELEARLLRAADLSLSEAPAGPCAPNRYRLRLHPRDLRSTPEELVDELAEAIEASAAEHGWRLEGPVAVDLISDAEVARGTIDWSVVSSRGPRSAWARLQSPHQTLPIRHNRVLIGREPSCDLVISNRQVSRVHARLWREGGSAWVEDLGSTNGTFVDGFGVPRPTALQPDSEITFGPVSFVFQPV